MSSTLHSQYLTANDIEALREILDQCGLTEQAAGHLRLLAGKALIRAFQQGATTRPELQQALARHIAISASIDTRLVSSVSSGESHRFGRRVERDRTWTIYHVFSGVPANSGGFELRGLDRAGAAALLDNLNNPAS